MFLKLGRIRADLFLRAAILALLTGLLVVPGAAAAPGELQVRLLFAGQEARVVLEDTPVARELCAMLPLDLTCKDYNATEKTAVLPKRLTIKDCPTSCDPEPGTLAYFIPWGQSGHFLQGFSLFQESCSPGTRRLRPGGPREHAGRLHPAHGAGARAFLPPEKTDDRIEEHACKQER